MKQLWHIICHPIAYFRVRRLVRLNEARRKKLGMTEMQYMAYLYSEYHRQEKATERVKELACSRFFDEYSKNLLNEKTT